jgi:hypothetical protein
LSAISESNPASAGLLAFHGVMMLFMRSITVMSAAGFLLAASAAAAAARLAAAPPSCCVLTFSVTLKATVLRPILDIMTLMTALT